MIKRWRWWRSLTVWSGVFLGVFLLAAAFDSFKNRSQADNSRIGLGLGFTSVGGRLVLGYHQGMMVKPATSFSREATSPEEMKAVVGSNRRPSLRIDQLPLEIGGGEALTSRYFILPYWTLAAGIAVPWFGLVVWRRKKGARAIA